MPLRRNSSMRPGTLAAAKRGNVDEQHARVEVGVGALEDAGLLADVAAQHVDHAQGIADRADGLALEIAVRTAARSAQGPACRSRDRSRGCVPAGSRRSRRSRAYITMWSRRSTGSERQIALNSAWSRSSVVADAAAELGHERREIGEPLRLQSIMDQVQDEVPLAGRRQADRARDRKGRRPEIVVERQDDVDRGLFRFGHSGPQPALFSIGHGCGNHCGGGRWRLARRRAICRGPPRSYP